MKNVFLMMITGLLSINAFAMSIPVSEEMVNKKINEQFPKTIKKIELSNPKIVLLENQSLLCMNGIPQIMFLNKSFTFCAKFKPVWNQSLTQLEATNLELTELNVDNIGNISSQNKLIINTIMSAMEAVVLYKSDNWLTKKVTDIKIEKSVMYIQF